MRRRTDAQVGRSGGASIEPTGQPTAGRRLAHRIGTWCALVVAVAAARLRRSRPRSSPPVSDDPGVVHLHGLGVNPRDGARYAATHSGLFVIREGAASRVADRYQDTMGFTVVGPDHFLGSGHGEQRRESLHPPVDGDVVDLDAALGEQLFGVAVGRPKRSYQRTASTMTSGGKQKPVNAERAWGAGQGRRVLMAAVCLLRALPTDVTVRRGGRVRADLLPAGGLDGFSAADGFIDAS